LVLTPTTTIAGVQKVKRNTVAEIYAQAIADLTTAEANLAGINDSYANSSSASAVLARIYLTQGKYELAETEATKIIGSGLFGLVKNFADEFQHPSQATRVFNSTEDIFAIQISSQSGFNALNEVYASSDFAGRGETIIFDQHYARYEDGDDRANEFYDVYTSKFNNTFGNVVTIRLAEIYLIRAEARILKTTPNLAGAAADINVIRNRAKLANTTATTVPTLLTALKKERRVELAFEGQRLGDLKRYMEPTHSIDGDGNAVESFDWNSPKLIFPIPKRELDANPNLTQNEGYQ
jgi:hypothetical protein